MYKTVLYHREEVLGEVDIYPQQQKHLLQRAGEGENGKPLMGQLKDIRIDHFSPSSDRAQPLAIVHTIASSGIWFKMESKQLDSPLHLLHTACVRESKTAVMLLGSEELHLVPMFSRHGNKPCFWGYNVAKGLYDASVAMLNLRCLGIVFDLDETLLVANTMRSFEDKIKALQRKISTELDPQRIAGLLAEMKRYQDDKIILKQYAENDQVIENGRVIKAQPEIVPPLSDCHQPLVRPLIRLQEKNIILTRINPQIRDTSVLVRLRPAWEDLRTYLTARGRKRFEVYVCTMAERDYALEMWRLLDPESNVINSTELLQRIVCVKSGVRKSLFSVFQDGICHPKMALVIDDRLKVWDDKDQPRVHVVPAFAPYYAPQAEANNPVPVLRLARNVACNVRGRFFRDYDECTLPRLTAISYEDAIKDIPSPDVGNYLATEEDASTLTGNKDPLGVPAAEAERRVNEAYSTASAISAAATSLDQMLGPSLPYTIPSSSSSIPLPVSQPAITSFPSNHFPPSGPLLRPTGHVLPKEPKLANSPAREEGEVPESELDPDTRRRLLILQHGQDSRDHTSSEPPFPVRPPIQIQFPRLQPRGSWFPLEEEMSPPQPNRIVTKEFPLDSEPMHVEKHRIKPSFFPKVERSIPSDHLLHENQRLAKEVLHKDDHLKFNNTVSSHYSFPVSMPGPGTPLSQSPSLNKDLDLQSEGRVLYKETPVGVLLDIAAKCGAKVEFRPGLVASSELQFSVEVWFSGEKIGEGIGRTRREAQNHAAERSIKNLANLYLSRIKPVSGSTTNGHAFLQRQQHPKGDSAPLQNTPESPILADARLEGNKKPMAPVSALEELCQIEGLGVVFRSQPPLSNPVQKNEVCAQVEVDGQVLGKGTGLTWIDAKTRAAEKALMTLGTTLCQSTPKRKGSPRSLQSMPPVKCFKQEFPGGVRQMPAIQRYNEECSCTLNSLTTLFQPALSLRLQQLLADLYTSHCT